MAPALGEEPTTKRHSNGSSKTPSTQTEVSKLVEKLQKHGNPALFVTPDHQIALQETEIPIPQPHEALIHVRCTGICGSDMHLWHRGAIGPLLVDRPCILGHEPSGVVLATGSAVTNLLRGDRIAIEPGVPCRSCWLCEAGKYNLCESVAFAGVCPTAGTIRRFITHDARYCHRIPDTMTFAQAALLEPFSVILHAIRQCHGSVGIGRPVLICGAGPIGLCALSAVAASGSWPVVITDIDGAKLDFARKLVPKAQTYKIDPALTPAQASEEIRKLFGCAPRDLEKMVPSATEYNAPSTVLECTGIESSVITAAYSCRRAGLVMVVGVGRSTMHNLPFMQLSLGEIDLRFINRYSDTWPAGINALNNGQVVNLDKMVTHTFPLERAVEAMTACADPGQATVKVHIVDDTVVEV
ncbi:hypothetical protein LTR62_000949 [Meristemomyces frigidus]|uniref:Sorbitol dehydrogenase n=1 Tax=Meristemomyces frigidus TaxID=1508187 RepID=A0AAN7YGL3_9PEZI|nr:hypothetical protein LTR62_000949 [Meristemomyces frigidus]